MTGLRFPGHLQEPLQALLRAFTYGESAGISPWDLAIELPHLQEVGLTLTDLRWLLVVRYVHHGEELTATGDGERSFRPLLKTEFPERTCVILTADGAAAAREACLGMMNRTGESRAAHQERTVPPPVTVTPVDGDLRPHWNPRLRELRLSGRLVKRYRVPAECQELILNAFEEEGWPECIDDPLHPVSRIDAGSRLAATIKALNRNQHQPLIRFHRNGREGLVVWRASNRLQTAR